MYQTVLYMHSSRFKISRIGNCWIGSDLFGLGLLLREWMNWIGSDGRHWISTGSKLGSLSPLSFCCAALYSRMEALMGGWMVRRGIATGYPSGMVFLLSLSPRFYSKERIGCIPVLWMCELNILIPFSNNCFSMFTSISSHSPFPASTATPQPPPTTLARSAIV